jgi:hypothetical protein
MEAKNKLIANFIQNIRIFSIVKVSNFPAIKNLILNPDRNRKPDSPKTLDPDLNSNNVDTQRCYKKLFYLRIDPNNLLVASTRFLSNSTLVNFQNNCQWITLKILFKPANAPYHTPYSNCRKFHVSATNYQRYTSTKYHLNITFQSS